MRAFVLCCLAVLTSLSQGNAHAAISSQERAGLIALYNATGGNAWTHNTSWNGAAGTECTWYGVTCDAASAHVAALNLHANHLVGPFPASTFTPTAPAHLAYVSSFDVGGNQLSGSLPSFANATNLAYLYLGVNQFT